MKTIFAVVALAIMVAAASAPRADDTVLTGQAAFADWKDDAPGVTRKIRVKDLALPFVSRSASNTAHPIPMPDGQPLAVPAGYKVELVAKGIQNPRAIRCAPNGDLFVADSEGGKVLVYRFDGDKPVPVQNATYVDGLH